MTLLEIMIVLAILALIMGLVIGPTIMKHFRDAKIQTARMAVKMYAEQDYPQWALAHHDPCPSSLAEMSHDPDIEDPWGTDYKMYCGATAPSHDVAFGAASFGVDRRENTDDDIRSWARHRDE
jgi:type II secretory pathway pseudopilin PulG